MARSGWRGMGRLRGNTAAVVAGADMAFRRGARQAAEEIMTDVKASRPGRGIPRDTGNLANTGIVEGPKPRGRIRVLLSFGGTAAKYGYRQHEDHTLNHKLGESRYLVRGAERAQRSGAARKALGENLRAVKGVS